MDELDEMTFEGDKDDNSIEEDVGFGSSLSKRKVFTDQGNLEIDSLRGKEERGELVLQPDFQRGFVWDSIRCSRLIESALLEIPIPMIYLSQEADGKEYVIDGQQRLTAFFSFIKGHFPENDKNNIKQFKLDHLKSFPELRGKSFRDLPRELQNKIKYYKINTIIFRKESDPNLKFEMFERLNTGAVHLNDQELRNCIYRGTYNKLLIELSEYEKFRKVIGIINPERRMKDVELVLRFAAFYHATYLNYKPPMKLFLNEEMRKYQFINVNSVDATNLERDFKNAVEIIYSLFYDNGVSHAFKRYYSGSSNNPNGMWEAKKFNYSLYDILMYSFSRVDQNKVRQNLDIIREALIYLMVNDPEFIKSIEISTSSIQAVTTRFDKWRLMLQDIIGISEKEPRLFKYEDKNKLFKSDEDNICDLCGQKIRDIDDAHVDHIEQYWKGGKTELSNARLTHRYCNMTRPRKE